MKKSVLGRGLGALIEEANEERAHNIASNNVVSNGHEIELSLIETNPFQPRVDFDLAALEDLSDSIKQLGVVQPITVREITEGRYQLIAGERRLRASKLAGLAKIPAFIRKADDQEMLEMALVENIQREDLNAIEIAISYQRLMDECKLTQESMSTRVGKKRSTVSNYLRLLRLPAAIQLAIKDKSISMGHARALITIENAESQLALFSAIVEQELSVRKTEEMVRDMQNEPAELETVFEDHSPVEKEIVEIPAEYINFQKSLIEKINAKVQLKLNENGSGKIVINYKSKNDLERIINYLNQINS